MPPPSAPAPPSPVEMTLRLAEGTRARLTLELLDETGQPQQTGAVELYAPAGEGALEETLRFEIAPPPVDAPPVTMPIAAHPWTMAFPARLFLLALIIYLGTRFIGLPDYPIYFFSDEAIPTLLALDLVRDNFVYENSLLPTYFRNDRKFSLGATVYLNILPAVLFGKSVWVARGTAVLFTLLGAASVGLILKRFFDKPYWWMGPLLLGLAPAWFLHSRTAFETAIAASFFAVFLYFYLLYRTENARYLYHALCFGALTFYSYAPAQLVIIAAGLGLLIVDFRYHWEHRQTGLRGAALLVLFALPYLRFHLTHPGAVAENLRESTSYLVGPYTPLEKLQFFLKEYLTGLSPLYWYFPNLIDIPRHVMGPHGNLLWITLPFALIGVGQALANIRIPAWRTILIAGLASPVGAAVAGLGVTRAMFFVIPITILTTLGLIQALKWIQTLYERRTRTILAQPNAWLEKSLFALLALSNFLLLGDALLNGPFWYPDYSFQGMQYGARQVFKEIEAILEESPSTSISLTPDFANGVTTLARFFLYDPLPIQLESLLPYQFEKREIAPNKLFVLTIGEYITLGGSGKFNIEIERTIEYPTGSIGFLFVRAAYVDNIDAILAQEAEARHQLFDASVNFEGAMIPVRYPKLDIGEIPNAFDNNDETVIRTAEANPLVIEMYLDHVRQIRGVELKIGATLARITVQVFPEFGAEPVVFTQEVEGFLDAPTVSMDFGETVPAAVIRLEIQDLRQGEPGHVHLWEVRLR
ncbi:MAG: hypothetical protein Fur0022_39970 [Anaerolineales bacterium]